LSDNIDHCSARRVVLRGAGERGGGASGKLIAARVRIDEGAQRALLGRGASLLAVGVHWWDAEFTAGDGIEILGPDGTPIARGFSALDSSEIQARRRNAELVHRDRLVLL